MWFCLWVSVIKSHRFCSQLEQSVQFSHSVISNSLWPHRLQHNRLSCPSPTWSLLKPCPLSRWCHTTISSTVISFSSCPQSFPASGSFQMSQFFTSGGQTIGVSASASVLPMAIQDWLPLGWTGLISLLSKGFSRVFFNKNSLPTDQRSPTTAIIYVKTCIMGTCIMPDFNIFFPSSFSLEKHFLLFQHVLSPCF